VLLQECSEDLAPGEYENGKTSEGDPGSVEGVRAVRTTEVLFVF
jgi:hypothetical protein